MNSSTSSRHWSSGCCTGGDFMKYAAGHSSAPERPLSRPSLAQRTWEMLLARHDPSDRRRALRELRDLARERRAPLILLPSLPEITAGNPTTLLETAQVPLQAILGALAR